MQSYRAEGYGRISPLSLLTHYLRYLDLRPPDDLSITSYYDNSRPLNREEQFHAPDVYTKSDHYIIMTLVHSEPACNSALPHYTSATIKMRHAISLCFPGPHNSMCLATTSL